MSRASLQTDLPWVLAEYHRRHDLRQVPVKVDNLKVLLQGRGCVDRIIWRKFEYDAVHVVAQVTFFHQGLGVYAGAGDYALVEYARNLNFCWERFVVCKEMYHCILDRSQETRISSVPALLTLAELLVSDPAAAVQADFAPHGTEEWAEVLALETLFPIELRSQHRKEYEAGLITDYQLALRYRIPEEYARMAMYPGYYENMLAARKGTLIEI